MTISTVALRTLQIMVCSYFCLTILGEFDFVVFYRPEPVHQHAKDMDSFGVTGCDAQKDAACIAEIALVCFSFAVRVYFLNVTSLTQAIFLFFAELACFFFKTCITSLMKPNIALLAERYRVVLFVIGAHASHTGRMEGIFCFSSFFILFLFDKILILPLFSESVQNGIVIMFHDLVIPKKIEIIYFFIFQ